MNLYTVTMKYTAVVVANSEDDACTVAHQERCEIVGDTPKLNTEIEVKEVRAERDLPDGWDDNCYPYASGPHEQKTIRTHLAAKEQA